MIYTFIDFYFYFYRLIECLTFNSAQSRKRKCKIIRVPMLLECDVTEEDVFIILAYVDDLDDVGIICRSIHIVCQSNRRPFPFTLWQSSRFQLLLLFHNRHCTGGGSNSPRPMFY